LNVEGSEGEEDAPPKESPVDKYLTKMLCTIKNLLKDGLCPKDPFTGHPSSPLVYPADPSMLLTSANPEQYYFPVPCMQGPFGSERLCD